jgi:hypothetical protein
MRQSGRRRGRGRRTLEPPPPPPPPPLVPQPRSSTVMLGEMRSASASRPRRRWSQPKQAMWLRVFNVSTELLLAIVTAPPKPSLPHQPARSAAAVPPPPPESTCRTLPASARSAQGSCCAAESCPRHRPRWHSPVAAPAPAAHVPSSSSPSSSLPLEPPPVPSSSTCPPQSHQAAFLTLSCQRLNINLDTGRRIG